MKASVRLSVPFGTMKFSFGFYGERRTSVSLEIKCRLIASKLIDLLEGVLRKNKEGWSEVGVIREVLSNVRRLRMMKVQTSIK